MAFDLNEFKSHLKGDLASSANFRVTFSGAIVSSDAARLMTFLCNSAQLPGRSFGTQDIITHGPVTKIPYQNIYDDVVLGFYCREDMGVKEMFQEWQNFICDNGHDHQFSYFDDYVSDLVIEQFDRKGKKTYGCKLIDAYPLMVAPLSTDWANPAFHNLQVTMAFRYWREEPLSLNPFGRHLDVNDLYPNFDVSGSLEKFGVSLFSRADGQFMSRVQQGANFNSNIGRRAISVRGDTTSTPSLGQHYNDFKMDNYFLR